MPYETPRMLGRTLRMLRKRAKLSQGELASRVGCSKSAISAYERREDNVDYELLDLYQLCFGAPNGVILAISHVAAMARDASIGARKADRELERKKLELMGRYLRNLSDRILECADEAALWDRNDVEQEEGPTWDLLLKDLFEATQKGVPDGAAKVFQNKQRLQRLVAERRGRSVANGQVREGHGAA
jgi:transcriptional regulator with XRE-family HTH domain